MILILLLPELVFFTLTLLCEHADGPGMNLNSLIEMFAAHVPLTCKRSIHIINQQTRDDMQLPCLGSACTLVYTKENYNKLCTINSQSSSHFIPIAHLLTQQFYLWQPIQDVVRTNKNLLSYKDSSIYKHNLHLYYNYRTLHHTY